MPPVRWKWLSVTIVWLQVILHTDAQFRQDEISMNGWRPIVEARTPNYYETFTSSPTSTDFYKYETFSTVRPTSAVPIATQKSFMRELPKPSHIIGRKIPHQKIYYRDPYFTLPTHGNHGPHIPIGSVLHNRPSQNGHVKQFPTTSRPYIETTTHISHNKQPATTNKPFLGSTSKRTIKPATGDRDDIFTASATSGAYNLYKQGLSNIRTRETAGLGLPELNHYSINQPHAHIEFNRYPLPSTSESIFHHYNNPFTFGKHPQSNDISYQIQQNDELTRNLLPPRQSYKHSNKNNNIIVQSAFQFEQQKTNIPQVKVQVTKEKLHEFHNNNPSSYYQQHTENDFPNVQTHTESSKPVYEVTENNVWQEPPSQYPIQTIKSNIRRPSFNDVLPNQPNYKQNLPIFLPTPYRPEKQAVQPTSPTEDDVSTIFTTLSKRQREKHVTTPDPFSYSVKEVSTHYPILGTPLSEEDFSKTTTESEEEIVTTRRPQRVKLHRRRRPDNRYTTTTTTPSQIDDNVPITEENTQLPETEKPIRIKRPNRIRTTTVSSIEEQSKPSRGKYRYTTRLENNNTPKRIETTTLMSENDSAKAPDESEVVLGMNEEIESEILRKKIPERLYVSQISKTPQKSITTTENVATTNLVLPEEEVEATLVPITEDHTTTLQPTTNTNFHRIRPRPIKFDNSNRPRFSVKDYRQKLNLHSSTTVQPDRTTETVRTRFNIRMRPQIMKSHAANEEDSTDRVPSQFMTTHEATTETSSSPIISKKYVKSVNTRLRPFGRYKTTTSTTTTTPKISIKPNLFNRKRPPPLTLRNKIFNKYNKTNTETVTEKVVTEEEVLQTTVEYENEDELVPTESTLTNVESTENSVANEMTTTDADISKIDPFFYSQRVSDLTSSSKNDYQTPGLFKYVSPTSRRIPNHFTIATEDPVLPIEAFFSNIKDSKDRES